MYPQRRIVRGGKYLAMPRVLGHAARDVPFLYDTRSYSESIERPQRVRSQSDPGADLFDLRRPFEQRDARSSASEGDCRGKPPDSASNDYDIQPATPP